MNIYIASRWANRELLRPIAEHIESLGHRVVARWLTIDEPSDTDQAIMDIEDLDSADLLVLFVDNVPQPERPYGGCFFEFGYAYKAVKPIVIVEPGRMHGIFKKLPGIIEVGNWNELYVFLTIEKDAEALPLL